MVEVNVSRAGDCRSQGEEAGMVNWYCNRDEHGNMNSCLVYRDSYTYKYL